MTKIGLVLEGGAARGIYTAGVLDVFLENHISVDGVIGVSAGAVHGSSYISGQNGRSFQCGIEYSRDSRYMSLGSLLKTGDLYNANFCYHALPEELVPFDYNAFEKSVIQFYVTCTDVLTGKPVYHECDSLVGNGMEWLRASASMPLVSKIVDVDGHQLLDGGISDSIPVQAFRNLGFKRNIVIMTRPEGYSKNKNRLLPLMKLELKQFPLLIEAIRDRHVNYNAELKEIEELQRAGEIFIIKPSRNLPMHRTERNLSRIEEMYELGRSDATNSIRNICNFIQRSRNH